MKGIFKCVEKKIINVETKSSLYESLNVHRGVHLMNYIQLYAFFYEAVMNKYMTIQVLYYRIVADDKVVRNIFSF